MRFGVPRTASPSPTRWQARRSTYGLRSSYDSDSDNFDSESDESLSYDISEDEFSLHSDDELDQRANLSKSQRSPDEIRELEETIASIRLRTRHHDPYEEWEKQTRKDAFITARKEQSTNISTLNELQERQRLAESQRLSAQHDRDKAQMQARLQQVRLQQQEEEKRIRYDWELRQRNLWNRIETAIKQEEDKVAQRLAEEQRVRDEEERKRKDEELKKRLAEEKRKAEEERIRKEEEEKKREEEEQKKKEEEEERLREEEERQKKERIDGERQQRQQLGLSTAEDDWVSARDNLKRLKAEMAVVKGDKALKVEWGKWRRQIRPKIGQLTNDTEAIDRITQELLSIINPPASHGPHHPKIYLAILSSLAKDIILQAETETTTGAHSAIPLARVAFNILTHISDFSEVLFAKLVQRVGGWLIPTVVPNKDFDGREWKDRDERMKAMGFRKNGDSDSYESEAEYASRVAGIMRVYFSILKIVPARGPLKPSYQLPKYWTWFARLLGERALMESPVAAQLMHAALDVLGQDALKIWGAQFMKMLALIYEGVTTGIGADKFIGGITPHGKSARVRVQLKIEEIIKEHFKS
ncbi:hypothetical protein NP233_g12387 [Leucocoprinus birnbaumii]|uniref:mRNA export factor GLE1 n=1 Tax=Leucocoprinus birnbaumii TaxID=56174 RepID=A0AAD5YN42_9AGAR|nr:hypothetical protein NP233_g12387 [Leucocoprinus birnbaumii]